MPISKFTEIKEEQDEKDKNTSKSILRLIKRETEESKAESSDVVGPNQPITN